MEKKRLFFFFSLFCASCVRGEEGLRFLTSLASDADCMLVLTRVKKHDRSLQTGPSYLHAEKKEEKRKNTGYRHQTNKERGRRERKGLSNDRKSFFFPGHPSTRRNAFMVEYCIEAGKNVPTQNETQ